MLVRNADAGSVKCISSNTMGILFLQNRQSRKSNIEQESFCIATNNCIVLHARISIFCCCSHFFT